MVTQEAYRLPLVSCTWQLKKHMMRDCMGHKVSQILLMLIWSWLFVY